jgi:hypothetical protein
VWYRVLSILTDLEFWAVAARLYDVRQAKRLFGLIGTGEVVARIAGAFSVPFFVRLVGVPNLMWLSAGGLLLCTLLAALVLRLIPDAQAPAAETRRPLRGARQQLADVASDRYLRIVTGIAVLAVLGKYFVDFAFLEQMRARYSDVKNLAGFFGVFSGLTQGLSLLTRLFLSGPLLERYGIRVGLLVLPLIQLACTGLIVLNGAVADDPGGALVFWLVIANQGIYKTLKHPIDNPSFKVLYQPLKAEQRLAAQITVEVVFTPIAIGVAGAIMLLMSTLIAYDPVRFSYVLLLNFALWALVARRGASAYQRALLDVLRRRIVDDAPFVLDDATSIALLRGKLLSPLPAEVIFALHLLEKTEYAHVEQALLERLEHPRSRCAVTPSNGSARAAPRRRAPRCASGSRARASRSCWPRCCAAWRRWGTNARRRCSRRSCSTPRRGCGAPRSRGCCSWATSARAPRCGFWSSWPVPRSRASGCWRRRRSENVLSPRPSRCCSSCSRTARPTCAAPRSPPLAAARRGWSRW